MRTSGIRALTCVGAVMLVAATGCTQHGSGAGHDDTKRTSADAASRSSAGKDANGERAKGKDAKDGVASKDAAANGAARDGSSAAGADKPAPGSTTVTLDDGRKVAMHYVDGKGLYEQHYSAASKWSASKAVYKTATDACQTITLKAYKGTVAAIADFGVYCSDGEPPTESIAAIGTGDLTTWAKSMTKDFDGWEKVAFADGGNAATFSRNSDIGQSYVKWSLKDGFSDPVIPTRPEDRIDEKFLGTWRLKDGSAQVTIAEPEAGAGVATFTALGDVRCVAEADVRPDGTDYVSFASDVAVTEGTETTNCPPPTETTTFELAGSSTTLHLKNVGVDDPETDLEYVRVPATRG